MDLLKTAHRIGLVLLYLRAGRLCVNRQGRLLGRQDKSQKQGADVCGIHVYFSARWLLGGSNLDGQKCASTELVQ